ncbi:MAG TPA: lysylphosphatidylglycerol synthase transmembrane domain-containing protein, partial [Gemmatimonadaceae bacterium]|nr:lysylphosphatidylglycerol synthase transmembrane domain-containing protein [Gemmatimonadaceae bacterium]
MPKLIAHLLCLALVAVDLIARTWRTQWMLSGLGYRLRFRELFIQTALGEAASSLTPLRLGGEPARVWAMRRAGVPTRPAIVAIGVELLAMVPVVVAMAVALAWRYAPEWWAAVGPALSSRARTGWPWVAAVVALSLLAWWLARRFAPSAAHAVREEIAAARASAREMPRWPLAASVPATIVSTAARVAILPVLALAIPEHVPLGTVTMGSFALIFGQLFLPTPAGAGAVE